MTDKEFQRLLRTNPDLVALDDQGQTISVAHGDAPTVTRVSQPKILRVTGLSEYQLQRTVFAEIDLRAKQDARWALIAAVPNGQYREGERMEPGLRKGFPDILWPLARQAMQGYPAYHGMVMELKVAGNTAEPEQLTWLNAFIEQGWYACIRRDDPAVIIQTFEWYLEGCQ